MRYLTGFTSKEVEPHLTRCSRCSTSGQNLDELVVILEPGFGLLLENAIEKAAFVCDVSGQRHVAGTTDFGFHAL